MVVLKPSPQTAMQSMTQMAFCSGSHSDCDWGELLTRPQRETRTSINQRALPTRGNLVRPPRAKHRIVSLQNPHAAAVEQQENSLTVPLLAHQVVVLDDRIKQIAALERNGMRAHKAASQIRPTHEAHRDLNGDRSLGGRRRLSSSRVSILSSSVGDGRLAPNYKPVVADWLAL